ncbi:unnamed protein product [Clavelina lepadiformis]|uniref:Fucosyltransferase N-terminal domain-containing protein n=1 Tax=Clavelina lepadiformis TaxID=159417 RepID=A0ABP0FS97_CLALP
MQLFAKWSVFFIFILSAIVTTICIYSTEVLKKTTASKFRSLRKISSSKKQLTNLIANTSRTYILFWDHPWSVPTEGFSEGNMGGCTGTYDRSKLPEAGAVVFHYSNLDRESMPWKHYRDPEQIFVFFSHESPSYVIFGEHRHVMTKFDDHFINWTMTYRKDSDVFAPYEHSKVMNKIIDEGRK